MRIIGWNMIFKLPTLFENGFHGTTELIYNAKKYVFVENEMSFRGNTA